MQLLANSCSRDSPQGLQLQAATHLQGAVQRGLLVVPIALRRAAPGPQHDLCRADPALRWGPSSGALVSADGGRAAEPPVRGVMLRSNVLCVHSEQPA